MNANTDPKRLTSDPVLVLDGDSRSQDLFSSPRLTPSEVGSPLHTGHRFRRLIDALERTASPVTHLSLLRLKNSQLPVNRTPEEIFIMIATYAIDFVGSDSDGIDTLIRLTHVCAQWRWIITTYPPFWTFLIFGGERGMSDSRSNLFFERAKGLPLDLRIYLQKYPQCRGISSKRNFTRVIQTLPPRQQIGSLIVRTSALDRDQTNQLMCRWTDALSSPQDPALRLDKPSLSSDTPTPIWEVLKNLDLAGCVISGLNYIRAPALTVLELFDDSPVACSVKRLFDFFDASPTLKKISIQAHRCVVDDFPPQDRKVMLPHLRGIFLSIAEPSRLASYLICPSKTYTHFVDVLQVSPTVSIFPQDFCQLLGQHSAGAIERVSMDIVYGGPNEYKYCSLRFNTSSGTTLHVGRENEFFPPASDNMCTLSLILNQAVTTLLSLPLDQVVAFSIYIYHPTGRYPTHLQQDLDDIKRRLTEALEGLPKLQEVELSDCLPGCFPDFSRHTIPPIQALVINNYRYHSWDELVESIIEVARAKHSSGIPFKRIEIATSERRPRIERLESLVQEVVYWES